jgi:ATP-binding cassette subfamily C protein
MLLVTLTLRCSAVQRGAGAAVCGLAKDIVYRIRIRLIERLKRISSANTKAWAAAR